ncbi:MAG TPA: ABC transporter permease [Thermodesulfovibrionales bacterium]|nr:ABC transporter permease [Thermodesulfovibrionales bacterium]
MGELFKEALEIMRYHELLRNLVIRDIKVRYKRSVLGFAWVMLNPLLMMLVLSLVFSTLFKGTVPNYTAYVLSGVIFWHFFSQGTTMALLSFTGNSDLLKKVYVPKAVFPLSVIISALVNLVLSLIPLFVILLITGTAIRYHVLLLPLGIILLSVFAFGFGLILSTVTVFFKDMIYIYGVLLMAWMYVTPIFYPSTIIPRNYRPIFSLNPLYHFIEIFRGCIFLDSPLIYEHFAYCLTFSALLLIAGWVFYHRYKDKIVYYL